MPPVRVIGLVASVVEDRHDPVAHELLELAAEPPRDQRCGEAPVDVEDGGGLGRWGALRECGEADEVPEEHADVLVPLSRRRQIETPEPLVAPVATGSEADARYAVTISPCHSHQLACHLRSPVTATPIIASDSSTKHAMTVAGSRLAAVPEDAPVARGANRVHERPEDRDHREEAVRVPPRCRAHRSGGRSATVQANHAPMRDETATRRSARRRISAARAPD